MLTLVCDLDGVVMDFDRAWVTRRRAERPDLNLRQNMPQRWGDITRLGGFDHDHEFWQWFDASGGWVGVPLYEGARDALWSINDRGWHIIYATNRRESPQTQNELVRFQLPQAHHLVHTKAKWEVSGDLYLEDSPGNLVEMRNRGLPVIRVGRPWNRALEYPELDGIATIADLTEHQISDWLTWAEGIRVG